MQTLITEVPQWSYETHPTHVAYATDMYFLLFDWNLTDLRLTAQKNFHHTCIHLT